MAICHTRRYTTDDEQYLLKKQRMKYCLVRSAQYRVACFTSVRCNEIIQKNNPHFPFYFMPRVFLCRSSHSGTCTWDNKCDRQFFRFSTSCSPYPHRVARPSNMRLKLLSFSPGPWTFLPIKSNQARKTVEQEERSRCDASAHYYGRTLH